MNTKNQTFVTKVAGGAAVQVIPTFAESWTSTPNRG
jgi:hypothetical protein